MNLARLHNLIRGIRYAPIVENRVDLLIKLKQKPAPIYQGNA